MRSIFLAFLFAITGALTMSQTATGDDKKADEKPKSPADKANYTEKVTVRQWLGAKTGFGKAVPDVLAMRGEIKGKTVIYTRPLTADAHSPKGSEITDKDGIVWVVDESRPGTTFHINYVAKKPAEDKKP